MEEYFFKIPSKNEFIYFLLDGSLKVYNWTDNDDSKNTLYKKFEQSVDFWNVSKTTVQDLKRFLICLI